MALVECGQGASRPPIGEDDDRRVGKAELEVPVPRADVPRSDEARRVERVDQVRACQIAEKTQLGIDAQTAQDQVVRLARRKGGDDKLPVPSRKRPARGLMVGVGRIGGRIEDPGVDDQRPRRAASSSRTIVSACRPIGSPVPRPAP
jgi:hypothetical protein